MDLFILFLDSVEDMCDLFKILFFVAGDVFLIWLLWHLIKDMLKDF